MYEKPRAGMIVACGGIHGCLALDQPHAPQNGCYQSHPVRALHAEHVVVFYDIRKVRTTRPEFITKVATRTTTLGSKCCPASRMKAQEDGNTHLIFVPGLCLIHFRAGNFNWPNR